MKLRLTKNFIETFKKLREKGFSLKQGEALVLACVIALGASGCAKQKDDSSTYTAPTYAVTETTTEKEEDPVYDFYLLMHSDLGSEAREYDWTYGIEKIKNTQGNVWQESFVTTARNSKLYQFIKEEDLHRNCELILFHELDDGEIYAKIFSYTGFELNDKKFSEEIIPLGDNYTFLEDLDGNCFILNHNTGYLQSMDKKYFDAKATDELFIVSNDEDGSKSLFYTDGVKALASDYDNICYSNGYLCLSKDNSTEIVDLETMKARKIPNTKVVDMKNDMIILYNSDMEQGVYRIKSIYQDLEEVIVPTSELIDFFDEDTNTFILNDYLNDTSSIKDTNNNVIYKGSGTIKPIYNFTYNCEEVGSNKYAYGKDILISSDGRKVNYDMAKYGKPYLIVNDSQILVENEVKDGNNTYSLIGFDGNPIINSYYENWHIGKSNDNESFSIILYNDIEQAIKIDANNNIRYSTYNNLLNENTKGKQYKR